MCLKALQLVQRLWTERCKAQGFDRVFEKVKIVSAGRGTCEAEMTVDESHTNFAGTMHGGFSASLVDAVSTAALLALPPSHSPGVSVNINMVYLKAASIGDDILIRAAADKVGKKLAFLSVQIVNKHTGAVIAQGSHTKYIL